MLSLLRFAVAMVLLAGWALAALSLHVVRTAAGVELIPKNKLSIVDTYVDVRHWSSDDEDKHPALYARLRQLDQTNLLEASAEPEEEAVPSAPTAVASSMSKAWSRANSRGR
jgi:hypothetical protein